MVTLIPSLSKSNKKWKKLEQKNQNKVPKKPKSEKLVVPPPALISHQPHIISNLFYSLISLGSCCSRLYRPYSTPKHTSVPFCSISWETFLTLSITFWCLGGGGWSAKKLNFNHAQKCKISVLHINTCTAVAWLTRLMTNCWECQWQDSQISPYFETNDMQYLKPPVTNCFVSVTSSPFVTSSSWSLMIGSYGRQNIIVCTTLNKKQCKKYTMPPI